MKKLLMIIMLLSARLTFACSVDDETCMHFFLEAQEMYNRPVQQQQYNNYNSGGRVYVKKPDAWGAVVINNLGTVATSGGKMSEEEAIKAAQSKCDGDCKAFFTYTNGYVAVVGGKVRGEGYYKGYFRRGTTEREAKRKTFKECEAEADECKLIGTDKSFF